MALDEVGFMLQPTCRRTWALRGRTPALKSWDRRDRRSVIGGLSLSPALGKIELTWKMHGHNIRVPEVCVFLRRQVQRHGKVLVVLDRWRVHRSAIRLLREELGSKLAVEWLPPYAPELNPVEQPWNHAKYTDLANFVPDDIVHLARRAGVSFYQQSRHVRLLRSYFQTAGLTP